MSSDGSGKKLSEECGGDLVENKVENSDSSRPDDSVPDISRVNLSESQLEEVSLEELRTLWRKQNSYISVLETRTSAFEEECSNLKDSEDKLKAQVAELALRERVLMRRLAAKEQDMQEYAGQVSEMKVPGGGALKNALLDPTVNLLLQRLRQELLDTKTRLEDTQNELSAWKFTPDSNTGKRLMAKCRLLHQENEELGAMISKGRLAKLEGDLALQKSFSEEVKKSQSDLDELLQDLDEDVEGMQSTIYYLQQELKKAKETISSLEIENTKLRSYSDEPLPKSPPAPVNGIASAHTKRRSSVDSTGSPTHDHLTHSLRTKDTDDDSVVNNNREGQRKRTSSENSDENCQLKRTKIESQLTVQYSDEEIITNGENGGQ